MYPNLREMGKPRNWKKLCSALDVATNPTFDGEIIGDRTKAGVEGEMTAREGGTRRKKNQSEFPSKRERFGPWRGPELSEPDRTVYGEGNRPSGSGGGWCLNSDKDGPPEKGRGKKKKRKIRSRNSETKKSRLPAPRETLDGGHCAGLEATQKNNKEERNPDPISQQNMDGGAEPRGVKKKKHKKTAGKS